MFRGFISPFIECLKDRDCVVVDREGTLSINSTSRGIVKEFVDSLL